VPGAVPGRGGPWRGRPAARRLGRVAAPGFTARAGALRRASGSRRTARAGAEKCTRFRNSKGVRARGRSGLGR